MEWYATLTICICISLVVSSSASLSTFLHRNKLKNNSSTEINMFEEETVIYELNCLLNNSISKSGNKKFEVTTKDLDISSLISDNSSILKLSEVYTCSNGSTYIHVKAGHLGVTSLFVYLLQPLNNKSTSQPLYTSIPIKVLRKITLFDEIAVFVLGPLVLINKCAFGAKIEVEVLKRVIIKPMELALCLFTQFVLMPLFAVLLGFVCNLSQEMALALLVCAACPGGGGGYVYSYLINGDITLAITASLVSTLFAMFAMPTVIGIYVSAVNIPNNISIPYLDILLMLIAIATPISCGMLIRKKWPLYAEKFIKIIQPLSLFLIAVGLTIVIVTSRYVLYGPRIGLLLAFLVPVSTFLIGICLARCFSFSWSLSKAISLESGLKNTLLGVAVIELSFPQPEADLASILIIMITVGQTLSGLIWYFLYLIKLKIQPPKSKHDIVDSIEIEETTRFLGDD